jgi:hypothetical protein
VLNCRTAAAPGELGAVQRTVVERAKQIVDGLAKEKPGASQITRVVPPDSDPSRLAYRDDEAGE